MKKITLKEYNAIGKDYRGVYSDFQGTDPELKGKRTMLEYDKETGGTVLIFEGIHFVIVD